MPDDRIEAVGLAVVFEGAMAGQRLIKDDPEREDVARASVPTIKPGSVLATAWVTVAAAAAASSCSLARPKSASLA